MPNLFIGLSRLHCTNSLHGLVVWIDRLLDTRSHYCFGFPFDSVPLSIRPLLGGVEQAMWEVLGLLIQHGPLLAATSATSVPAGNSQTSQTAAAGLAAVLASGKVFSEGMLDRSIVCLDI